MFFKIPQSLLIQTIELLNSIINNSLISENQISVEALKPLAKMVSDLRVLSPVTEEEKTECQVESQPVE